MDTRTFIENDNYWAGYPVRYVNEVFRKHRDGVWLRVKLPKRVFVIKYGRNLLSHSEGVLVFTNEDYALDYLGYDSYELYVDTISAEDITKKFGNDILVNQSYKDKPYVLYNLSYYWF